MDIKLAAATTVTMKSASPLARLMAAHPRLFRGQEPICWSDVPEGWWGIVDEVCSSIESLLTSEQLKRFEVLQIKQKFGGLRFYWRLHPADPAVPTATELHGTRRLVSSAKFSSGANLDAVRVLVDAANAASMQTCEICGRLATQELKHGAVVTLCLGHANQ